MKRVLLTVIFILLVSRLGSAQQFTYYFPQIAIGPGYITTIFLSNATATGGAERRSYLQNPTVRPLDLIGLMKWEKT